MVSDLPTLKKNLGEISDVVLKTENVFTKAAKRIQKFQRAEEGREAIFKRIVYSIRGSFTVLNKAFIGFSAVGKIYDKTVGSMTNRNSPFYFARALSRGFVRVAIEFWTTCE